MRVKSEKPHTFTNGAIGWYHWLKDPLPDFKPQPKRERPEIKVRDILTDMDGNLSGPTVESLAKSLGVTYSSLRLLGVRWSAPARAWAFPMRGGDGEYVGIRLRNSEGRKWAVTGSKEGVFFAFGNPDGPDLFVVEGPTDTAAAMSIGLDCVGRPSCYGGVEEIRIIVRNAKYRRVVVIADNDEAGLRGAKTLMDALFVPRCLLNLPAKDMREFVKNGGSRAMIYFLLNNVLWTRAQPGQSLTQPLRERP